METLPLLHQVRKDLCVYHNYYPLVFNLGEDFNTSAVVAQISPGDTEHSVFIPIFNDMNLEQTELFEVTLNGTTADTSTGVTLGSIQRAEVTIVDRDSMLDSYMQIFT